MDFLKGKKIVLIIAGDGYQSTEYEVPKNILEKNGIIVTTASDIANGAIASDKSTTLVDISIDALNPANYDGIFFIGGPGAMEHLDNSISYKIANKALKLGIPYGAICISVRILAKGKTLEGVRVTGWDDDNALETILRGNGAQYAKGHSVITDGIVVTAIGPKAAEEFAEGIIRVLTQKTLQKN